jgi:hypothetical protein
VFLKVAGITILESLRCEGKAIESWHSRASKPDLTHFTFPGWGMHRAFSGMQRIHQRMTPEACEMVECWLASKKRDG